MNIDAVCFAIAQAVGISAPRGPALTGEIRDLAERAMVADDLPHRPKFVASEITRYLDDIARNP